jgi:hypothetical protein
VNTTCFPVLLLFGNQHGNGSFQGALVHRAIALHFLVLAKAVFRVTCAIDELKHAWIQESCADPQEFGSTPAVTVVM